MSNRGAIALDPMRIITVASVMALWIGDMAFRVRKRHWQGALRLTHHTTVWVLAMVRDAIKHKHIWLRVSEMRTLFSRNRL
jgi:hypothetical protein